MKSVIGLVRVVAGLAAAILILVMLSNFVPGFVGFVFGTLITIWLWPSALLMLALLNKGWRVGGKVELRGWGRRSKFAFLRTLRDIDFIEMFYDRMVYGDDKHEAQFTARQRLLLEHFDGYLDKEELKEALAALKPKKRAPQARDTDTSTAQPAAHPQTPRVRPAQPPARPAVPQRQPPARPAVPQRQAPVVPAAEREIVREEPSAHVQQVRRPVAPPRPAPPAPQRQARSSGALPPLTGSFTFKVEPTEKPDNE